MSVNVACLALIHQRKTHVELVYNIAWCCQLQTPWNETRTAAPKVAMMAATLARVGTVMMMMTMMMMTELVGLSSYLIQSHTWKWGFYSSALPTLVPHKSWLSVTVTLAALRSAAPQGTIRTPSINSSSNRSEWEWWETSLDLPFILTAAGPVETAGWHTCWRPHKVSQKICHNHVVCFDIQWELKQKSVVISYRGCDTFAMLWYVLRYTTCNMVAIRYILYRHNKGGGTVSDSQEGGDLWSGALHTFDYYNSWGQY